MFISTNTMILTADLTNLAMFAVEPVAASSSSAVAQQETNSKD